MRTFSSFPPLLPAFAAVLFSACLADPQGLSPNLDGGTGSDGGSITLPTEATACSVAQSITIPKCTACHGPGGQTPELTLDAVKTQLVGVESKTYPGRILVVAGDPDSSFFYQKIAGTQGANEGDRMPPAAAGLNDAYIAHVRSWIESGASVDCTPTGPDPDPEAYHPVGFANSTMHGVELELGLQDCRNCHGSDLTGGTGPSCDSCHETGWRTDCTFCHGGSENQTGAPPRDLGLLTDPNALSFRAHTSHVTENNHSPFDCTQCHDKPDNVLSENHVFDSTPGQAEVKFTAGLSPNGQYTGNGACTNLYCHGNGRGLGAYDDEKPTPTCTTCHYGMGSSRLEWRAMSGRHADHLREGFTCVECHQDTSNTAGTGIISPPAAHVDGQVELSFAGGTITHSGGTCTGSCHNENHDGRSW